MRHQGQVDKYMPEEAIGTVINDPETHKRRLDLPPHNFRGIV